MSHNVPKSIRRNFPRKSPGTASFLPSTVVTSKAGAGSPTSSVTPRLKPQCTEVERLFASSSRDGWDSEDAEDM